MLKYILIFFTTASLFAEEIPSAWPKLHSLMLPGWGELDLGEVNRAEWFFIQEAALWLVYFGATKSSNWYESDYLAFAEIHAGVDMQGKNYLYAVLH